MPQGRHFAIRYTLDGERKFFVQPDSKMTDADAWYYACLHAGIGVLHNLSGVRAEIVALQGHAERAALTDVTWEQLL